METAAFDSRLNSLYAAIGSALMLIAIVGGGAVVLGFGFAWIISRGIAAPIGAMTNAMTELASGKLDIQIPAQSNKDEIGGMAKALVVFRDAANDKVRMEREAEEARVAAEAARVRAQEEAIAQERALVSQSIRPGACLAGRKGPDLPSQR